jgi:hypothetical protein
VPLTPLSASTTSADSGPRHRRRRGRLLPLISAGITAILALAGVVAISSPAVADDPVTGEISGLVNVQVAAPAFFDPANDTTDVVQIHAYRVTGTSSNPTLTSEGFTSTHADGTWSFDSLPVGKYAFDFEYHGTRTNLIAHVFDRGAYTQEEVRAHVSTNTTTIAEGESHVVDDGYVSAGADLFTLVTGASTPLDGQPVTLWRLGTDVESGGGYWAEDDPWAELTTSGGGNATFSNLPPGQYTMRAGDGSGGWVPQFYDGDEGTTRPQDADIIDVSPASGMPINIDLEQGGAVSGTVTNTAGTKLAGVEVTAYALDSEDDWHLYSGPVTTAANGTYTLGGLPTGVDLTLHFEAATYLSQYWKGVASPFDATGFSLTSTTTRTGFNAKLTKGASISGVLTTGPTLHPDSDDVVISACKNLPGGSQPDCLELEDPPGYGHVSYDSGTGAYSITGLAAGTYTVQVQYVGEGNFRNEFFSDKRSAATATTFAVAAGASVTGKNIQLDAGAILYGNVHHGVDPVPGATVTVYPESEYFYDEANFVDSAVTGPDGNYFIAGLEQGDYIILVTPPEDSGLAQQWYGGQTLHDYATSVHVDAFTSFGPYEVDLQGTGRFHGTITDYLGDPISDAIVSLYRYVTVGSYRAVEVDYTFTDLSGDYSFEDVAPGEYTIYAEGGGSPAGDGFVGRYNGAVSEAGIAGATRTFLPEHDDSFISFSLDLGGRYIGRVTDGTDPISGADVITHGSGTSTQGDGTFMLTGLSQGTHTVSIDASAVTDTVVSTRDISAPAVSWNAPPVDLGDIALEEPSTLNGVVLGSNGTPVKFALIGAFTIGDQLEPVLVGLAVADSKGRFSIGDLPSDPVYLYVPSAGTKYASQWAGGGSEWAQSTPVDFTDPGTTKFREVRLMSGSTITGTVKNGATGKGIKNLAIGIARLDAQGTIVDYQLVPTNSKGVYTAHGLDAGSYTVYFNEFGLGSGGSYNIAEKTVYVADRTTVKVNATLSGAPAVSGIVTGPSGPLADVDVSVYDAAGSLVDEGDSATSTDDQGRYTLHLQPGTYRLFFSDPERRVASAFLGGGTVYASATPVVVAKKSLTGRNILLSAAGGTFSAIVEGDSEPDPEGYMKLEYVSGGDVQASEWVYGDQEFSELTSQLPIRSLAAGDYRLTFYGFSQASQFGGEYADLEIDFTITDGLDTNVGTLTLTGLHNYDGDDFPQVVAGGEPVINFAPSPRVGDMLTTVPGVWNPTPDQFFYQWLRNGKPIPGANDDFYLLQPADAGASISLRMGASRLDVPGPNYSTLVKMDDLIGPAPAPSQVDPFDVLGDARVGATVTAQPGNWDTEGLSFTYQWYRGTIASPIDGATGATYKPVVGDIGSTLGVEITSHRTGYLEASVDILMGQPVTPAMAVKLVTAPKVTDTGDGWKISTGTWSPSGTNLSWEFRKYDPSGDTYTAYLGEVLTPNELHDAGLHDGVGRFTVVVTATRASYRPTSVEIELNKGPAAFYDVEPTVVSGTPTVGLPVEFDFGSGVTVPTTTSRTFQWFRGATKITGATGALYTPKLSDEGFALSLVVTLKAPGYATGTATLVVPGTVAGAPPITAGSTGFSGAAIIGRPLTVITTGWTPEPTGYTYTWYRDGVLLPGVTKATYTPIFADESHVLSVDVVGMRSGHANSAPEHITTAGVISLPLQSLAPPSIPKILHPGVKITVNTGVWDLAPKSFTYQWFVNSAPIIGATGSTFTPRVEDVGETIHVVVNAFRSGVEGSGDIESTMGYVDPGAAVKATKLPKLTVAGKSVTSLKLGQTVAATTGSWPTSALELTYQWQVDDGAGSFRDIAGANDPTLFLDGVSSDFDVTFKYRVKITGTRSGYLDSVAISKVLTIVS